jgi:hypothetical protein
MEVKFCTIRTFEGRSNIFRLTNKISYNVKKFRCSSNAKILILLMQGDVAVRICRVSIKSFPDYKHVLQENYV